MGTKTNRYAVGAGKSYNLRDDYTTVVTSTANGGAIYTVAGWLYGGTNCRVYDNQALKNSGGSYGHGGGLYVGGTTVQNSIQSGYLMCLSYPGVTGPGQTSWPMRGADARHSGVQKQ